MARSKKKRAKTDAYPYVSYRTFQSFVDNLVREGVPSIVDRAVMQDLNGFNQGLVLATLRFMDLIDANGKVLPGFRRLAKGWKNNRPRVFGAILKSAYPDLLAANDFDLESANPGKFDARFSGIASSDVQRKAKTFFLRAAADAGVPISPRIQPSLRGTRRGAGMPGAGSRLPAPGNGAQPILRDSSEPPIQLATPLTFYQLELQRLREEFPVFNDEWSTEEKTEWYQRRFELLDRILASTQPDSRGEDAAGVDPSGARPSEPGDESPIPGLANDPSF